MAAQIDPIETDEEFMDGISPNCLISNEQRTEAVSDAVAHYGRKSNSDPAAIHWGSIRARNALQCGETGHRAIRIGQDSVDEFQELIRRNPHPITGAFKAAQAIGLVDIQVTADGVRGHRKHGGQWYEFEGRAL